MKIAGLIKNSFVDYPGQIAAVVFTPGCNYDCFFCHNRTLIESDEPLLNEDEVLSFLKKRQGLLDGVVITGGEPTLQKGLKEFIIKIINLNYKIKLDTNGAYPHIVSELLDNKLIDYIAMDYKAPFERYQEICGDNYDIEAVKETLDIIKKSGLQYELRTTFIPQLDLNDIEEMLKAVTPIESFAIQHYKIPEVYKEQDLFKLKKTKHSSSTFQKAEQIAKKYAKKVIIR